MPRRLLTTERIVCYFTLFAAALSFITGVTIARPIDIFLQRLGHTAVFYVLGLTIALLLVRLGGIKMRWRDTWQRYQDRFLTGAKLRRDARIIVAISLMFTTYIALKHLTPILRPNTLDPLLWRSESTILGEIAGIALQRWLGVGAAPLLSFCYMLFYPFMALAMFIVLLGNSRAWAEEFFAAFALTWFLGILLVYAFPSWGPCFYRPDAFAHLPYTTVTELQSRLWAQKVALDSAPYGRGLYLISGFPSLHFAVPLLCSLYLGRIHPALRWVAATFTAVTAVTTIYFGWHYVVDDLGSILLVGCAVALARRLNAPDAATKTTV